MNPEGDPTGDQVFTGRDSFNFGTSRSDMERMMKLRNPFVVTNEDPDEQPFLATEKGQKWIAGAVFAAYWGAPIVARAKKSRRARRNREQPNADQ